MARCTVDRRVLDRCILIRPPIRRRPPLLRNVRPPRRRPTRRRPTPRRLSTAHLVKVTRSPLAEASEAAHGINLAEKVGELRTRIGEEAGAGGRKLERDEFVEREFGNKKDDEVSEEGVVLDDGGENEVKEPAKKALVSGGEGLEGMGTLESEAVEEPEVVVGVEASETTGSGEAVDEIGVASGDDVSVGTLSDVAGNALGDRLAERTA